MSISELMTSLGPILIPKATAYRIKDRLIALGLAKPFGKHKIAWIDYSPLQEDIVKEIERFRAENLVEPSEREIAARVGIPPDDDRFKKPFWRAVKRTGLDVSIHMITQLSTPSFVELKAVRAEIQGKQYKHTFDVVYQLSSQLATNHGRVAVRIFSTSPDRAVQKAAGELLDIPAEELDGFIAAMIQTAGETQRTFRNLRYFLAGVGDRLHIPTEVVLVKKQKEIDAVVKDVQHIAASMLGRKVSKKSRKARQNLNLSKERRERKEKAKLSSILTEYRTELLKKQL